MKQWETHDGVLMVADRKVSSIAEQYGTPLYLYDSSIIKSRYEMVRRSFPAFEVLYAAKANPNRAIMNLLRSLGARADVTALLELETALAAGFNPGKITYGGPGKTRKEIERAVSSGVGVVNAESERELEILRDIGNEFGITIPVTVRINTRHKPSEAGELMAGGPSWLGIDEERFLQKSINIDVSNVDVIGIHTHVASQVLDLESLVNHYHTVMELSKTVADLHRFELELINFGGGIGVPYSSTEEHVRMDELGDQVQSSIDTIFAGEKLPRMQLELGRYLVAEAGIYLTSVLDVKESRGSQFVITDSGINGFSRPAMPWAQQHKCTIISKESVPSKEKYKVVGRSCMPSDVLSESAFLPKPEPGDIIAFHNAGAYGYTMSMVTWASLASPAEVFIDQGKTSLVRDRIISPENVSKSVGVNPS